MAHMLSVIDLAGMACAFLLLWSQKEEIIYGMSVMHYSADEKDIAKAVAAVFIIGVMAWPLTLGSFFQDHWPDP